MTAVGARPRDAARRLGSLTQIGHLFAHQLRRTRRVWWSSIANGLATPTLWLLAIGVGLGSQIDDAELARLGVDDYIDFVGPGLLAVTAMQIASTEALWPTRGLLKWEGIYKAVLATPLGVGELAVGHALWISFRGLVTACCYLVVLAVASAATSWWALLLPAAAFLIGLAHAAPMLAVTVTIEVENVFPMIVRLVLFPLYLFSGAFFPVDDMPAAFALAAKLTPSWHGVELCRSLASGSLAAVDLLHAGYLAAFGAAGLWAAQKAFRKELTV